MQGGSAGVNSNGVSGGTGSFHAGIGGGGGGSWYGGGDGDYGSLGGGSNLLSTGGTSPQSAASRLPHVWGWIQETTDNIQPSASVCRRAFGGGAEHLQAAGCRVGC